MKIIYCANVRMPTEKAHGIQIMKTCEALVACGYEVELLVPDRKTSIPEDAFSYYGVSQTFSIRRLQVMDTVSFGTVGFYAETLSFSWAVRKYLGSASFDLLYSRDELVLRFQTPPYVWESHTGAWSSVARVVAERAKRMIVISQGLKDFYIARGVSAEKICVAHDGVDLEAFAHPESKEVARTRLGLPQDASIAMYIGRLDGWKGIDTFLEASAHMKDIQCVIIGGEPHQVEELSRRYPQVRFLGAHPYRALANNMAAADVLVLPNTGKDEISVSFTSPLKLFAYMTSGIPIVASDLPSIREVVDDTAAYLVPPDDAHALADGIQKAIAGGNARAEEARTRVVEYSWKRRVERIMA